MYGLRSKREREGLLVEYRTKGRIEAFNDASVALAT
jgi:hypothetical protein